MLTFQKIRSIFWIAFAFSILAFFFYNFSWYFLGILPLLYSIVLALGSAFIGLRFFIKSICKAETNEKLISLTFDDGPDHINTAKILAMLKSYQLTASFFIIGKKIKGNETLLRQLKEDGHLIANHSFSHSYFYDFYPSGKVTEDLLQTNKSIKETIGLTPLLFRPPYGVTNPNIAKAVNGLKLTSIGWNIRSLDTVIQDKDKLSKRVTDRIQPGSILLFHDTGVNTLETLEEVILFTQKNGYKIIGLDKLLNIKAYEEI